MPNIPFTQFILPNGRRKEVLIDRPQPIYDKAMLIINAGYRFECEILMSGTVSLTITTDDDDIGDVAIKLCPNNIAVLASIDAMINEFKIP